MTRQTPLIIGSVLSLIIILIFVGLTFGARVETIPSVSSDTLDIQSLRENLSIISQKEKNGDLPVQLNPETLERDDPFGGL